MKTVFDSILFLLLGVACFAQPIPTDSLYLGQTPPGNAPKKFELAARKGCFVVERIAISPNGKEIAFEQIGAGQLTYYKYSGNKWSDTIALFQKSGSPAYSVDGNTLYFGKNGITVYSVRNNSGWSEPIKFSSKILYWHYLQVTNSDTYYAAIKNAKDSIGGMDWSKLTIRKSDTIITSLGLPINSKGDDMDFYIARDESYIIFASDRTDIVKYGYSDLFVSFRRNDNTWTTPQNLGEIINNPGEARWGPFVSPDRKYLFYSRTSKPDYSDACTYWIRIDNILDSLRKTMN